LSDTMYLLRTNLGSDRMRSGRAQLAALDIVLVVVLIIAAASVLQCALQFYGEQDRLDADIYLTRRAKAVLRALLTTTVDTDELYGTCAKNALDRSGWQPISKALAEHMLICSNGGREDPAVGQALKLIAGSILDNLTGPGYGYAFNAEFRTECIKIVKPAEPDSDISCSEDRYLLAVDGGPEAVSFKLGLWRL